MVNGRQVVYENILAQIRKFILMVLKCEWSTDGRQVRGICEEAFSTKTHFSIVHTNLQFMYGGWWHGSIL